MPIIKPFYRISRPSLHQGFENLCAGYKSDPRYIDKTEQQSLIHAAFLIVNDFMEIFNFIEPCDANQSVYSHRIFELLLRTATEFEANCIGILKSNHVNPFGKDYNIRDYYKLNSALYLSKYNVKFSRWAEQYYYRPFIEWDKGPSLSWYQAYNHSKHNRFSNYKEANLYNLLISICGLICVLHAQFDITLEFEYRNYGKIGIINGGQVIFGPFTIYPPKFNDEDKYSFNWKELSLTENPFSDYPFI